MREHIITKNADIVETESCYEYIKNYQIFTKIESALKFRRRLEADPDVVSFSFDVQGNDLEPTGWIKVSYVQRVLY